MPQLRDEELLKKIALKIKALREVKDVSQDDVYNEIDINLARIETGKNNLSISTLSKLCSYFGISLSDFFDGM